MIRYIQVFFIDRTEYIFNITYISKMQESCYLAWERENNHHLYKGILSIATDIFNTIN